MKRFFINSFFLILSVFALLFLLKLTNGQFLIAVYISFFCIGCPIVIFFSSKAILDEKCKIDLQKSHDLPLSFDRKKVIWGYIGTLFLFWFLPIAVFLLPDKTWVLTGPPIWLCSFAVIQLTEHTWLAFGWKKRTYWILQGTIIFILMIIVGIIRGVAF